MPVFFGGTFCNQHSERARATDTLLPLWLRTCMGPTHLFQFDGRPLGIHTIRTSDDHLRCRSVAELFTKLTSAPPDRTHQQVS